MSRDLVERVYSNTTKQGATKLERVLDDNDKINIRVSAMRTASHMTRRTTYVQH